MRRKDNDREEGEGLLSRWSKRKLAAKSEADEQPAAAGPAAEVPLAQEPAEDPILKANREAAEAIDIETLEYESDFGPFLKAGVPAILKRRALRKLWNSHPVLANLDGLNDYDTDFTQPATNVFKSAWKVGRGYLDHLASGQEGAEAEAATTQSETPEAGRDAPANAVDAEAAATGDDQVSGRETAQAEIRDDKPAPGQQRVSLRQRLMG